MNYDQVLFELRKQRNPKNVEGMARFGINPTNTLGVSIKVLREIAKRVRKEEKDGEKRHQLALRLWASSIHEGRILATIIDPPELVTENQAESWVEDLDSWDICDGFCMNLIDKTKFAYQKAMKWAKREEEYIRRAGFATMAALSVHDKDAPDTKFEKFFL